MTTTGKCTQSRSSARSSDAAPEIATASDAFGRKRSTPAQVLRRSGDADEAVVPAWVERYGQICRFRIADEIGNFRKRRVFGDVKVARLRRKERGGKRRRPRAADPPGQECPVAARNHRDRELRAGIGGAFEPGQIDTARVEHRFERPRHRIDAEAGDERNLDTEC